MKWEPIETAPKDGTAIMLWTSMAKRPVFCRWSIAGSDDGWWSTMWGDEASGNVRLDSYTHWQPIPPGPHGQIEEPALAGDEVDPAAKSAGLTHNKGSEA